MGTGSAGANRSDAHRGAGGSRGRLSAVVERASWAQASGRGGCPRSDSACRGASPGAGRSVPMLLEARCDGRVAAGRTPGTFLRCVGDMRLRAWCVRGGEPSVHRSTSSSGESVEGCRLSPPGKVAPAPDTDASGAPRRRPVPRAGARALRLPPRPLVGRAIPRSCFREGIPLFPCPEENGPRSTQACRSTLDDPHGIG